MSQAPPENVRVAWEQLLAEREAAGSGPPTSDAVLALGAAYGITGGKWLIYTGAQIDAVWEAVSEAVVLQVGRGRSSARQAGLRRSCCCLLFGCSHSQPALGPQGLGRAAKVSPPDHSKGDSHVICAYHPNFADEAGVVEMGAELRRILSVPSLLPSGTITFKPDVFTLCGVYARNRWNIPPTTHQLKWRPAAGGG